MAEVDLAREPPDASYDHPISNRRYQVVRRDGRMWHRELRLTDDPEEVLLSEFPAKYVVGSGRHSLTYLVEEDGFLMESPVTWYTSKKAWGMSPGYDRPMHSSFEREVGEGCLICHAGQAETVGGSMHRMHIVQPEIGCEQCHGPGSLHVQRQSQSKRDSVAETDEVDYTIVNPTHLSRALKESICEQCHLRGEASITSRGVRQIDFRPGLRLEDFQQFYRLDMPDRQMTVVGHVEQMYLSDCYKKSAEFTCLTCHNPHADLKPEKRSAHYQAVCLKCHSPGECNVAEDVRRQESPESQCIHCHMPTSTTDIPHLAFTHHRVGLHPKRSVGGTQSSDDGNSSPVLIPFHDLTHLSEMDRKRSLGLAYLEAANQKENEQRRPIFEERAVRLLMEVRAGGMRDGIVDARLAKLRFDAGLGNVQSYAASALSDRNLDGQDKCHALFLMADAFFSQNRYGDALSMLDQLKPLRRHSLQSLLRAQCEKGLGNHAAMEEALQQAVRLNPSLADIHKYLAAMYRERGDSKRAHFHEKRSEK